MLLSTPKHAEAPPNHSGKKKVIPQLGTLMHSLAHCARVMPRIPPFPFSHRSGELQRVPLYPKLGEPEMRPSCQVNRLSTLTSPSVNDEGVGDVVEEGWVIEGTTRHTDSIRRRIDPTKLLVGVVIDAVVNEPGWGRVKFQTWRACPEVQHDKEHEEQQCSKLQVITKTG
jgi:hypothetical protein